MSEFDEHGDLTGKCDECGTLDTLEACDGCIRDLCAHCIGSDGLCDECRDEGALS